MKMTGLPELLVQFETIEEHLLYDIAYAAGQKDAWHVECLRKRVEARKLLEYKEEMEEDDE